MGYNQRQYEFQIDASEVLVRASIQSFWNGSNFVIRFTTDALNGYNGPPAMDPSVVHLTPQTTVAAMYNELIANASLAPPPPPPLPIEAVAAHSGSRASFEPDRTVAAVEASGATSGDYELNEPPIIVNADRTVSLVQTAHYQHACRR